jgi:hypothetical protein
MLDYFFASNYQAAGAQAGQGNAVLDTLMDAVDAGGATLLTSVVFGPEAGAVELLADAGKDAFSSAAESTLGKITGPLADSGDGGASNASADADNVFSNLTTIQGKWSSDVTTAWNQSVQNHSTATDFPQVYYNGVPYTGNPQQYEQQYGGNFLNSDGTVMNQSQMNAKQLAAFNAWLQDPAISNVVATNFAAESQGSFGSYYSSQLSGGSGG